MFTDRSRLDSGTAGYSVVEEWPDLSRHQNPFELTRRPMCDTGTSGQRRSDGNIELVRFLDSHEGDGARAVFAGVQLLYKNKTPHGRPSKIAHRKGIHSE